MRQYIGLIHKDAESDYGVSFPDFPGAVTAGTSLDDARGMAEEALAFHIEGLVADGEAIPEPSTLEFVMADPTNRDGVAILVVVKTETPKAVRVNVTLPEDVLLQIDRYAEEQGYTRSGFLTHAAKDAMKHAVAAVQNALTGRAPDYGKAARASARTSRGSARPARPMAASASRTARPKRTKKSASRSQADAR